MSLSKDEIKHIAKLARLELSSAELEKYGEQLSNVLGYIDKLQEVSDQEEIINSDVIFFNNFRSDDVKEWQEEEKLVALHQAADLDGDQVRVKKILN